jgi:hypothetical protein
MKADEGRDESRQGSSSGQMQQPSSQKVSEQKEPWKILNKRGQKPGGSRRR